MTSADYDSDGDSDIVSVNDSSQNLSVLLNDGGGKLSPSQELSIQDSLSVISADLNGDGAVDLAATSNRAVLYKFMNRGDGTFAEKIQVGVKIGTRSIVAADLDVDGDVGLATSLDPANQPGMHGMAVWRNSTVLQASQDQDQNSIPDECERTLFHRGDPNGDGNCTLSDCLYIINFQFHAGPASDCEKSSDVNFDDQIDIADAIYLLYFLFFDGPSISDPGPPPLPCGPGPYVPESPEDLLCESYEQC